MSSSDETGRRGEVLEEFWKPQTLRIVQGGSCTLGRIQSSLLFSENRSEVNHFFLPFSSIFSGDGLSHAIHLIVLRVYIHVNSPQRRRLLFAHNRCTTTTLRILACRTQCYSQSTRSATANETVRRRRRGTRASLCWQDACVLCAQGNDNRKSPCFTHSSHSLTTLTHSYLRIAE